MAGIKRNVAPTRALLLLLALFAAACASIAAAVGADQPSALPSTEPTASDGDEVAGPECVKVSTMRTVCTVRRACVSSEGVLFSHEPQLKPICRLSTLEPFTGNCEKEYGNVLKMYPGGHAVVMPEYPYVRGNVYHFGRSFTFALHVAWNPWLYRVPNVRYAVMKEDVVQAKEWNRELSSAASEEFVRLNLPKAERNALCFDSIVLLGSDIGPIFQNRWHEVQPGSKQMSTLVPPVPADALRFKQMVHSSLGLATEHLAAVDTRSTTLTLSPPPAVIAVNGRGGGRAAARRLSPPDEERLEALLRATAQRHRLELRHNVFSGLNFSSQVKAMHDVGLTVGIHGANMMNAIFQPPLGALVEIFPRYYLKECYVAGGNGGLQYDFVSSDDPSTVDCRGKTASGMDCQRYLKNRKLYLSEERWKELEDKLNDAAVYLNILRRRGAIPLQRSGEVYKLLPEVQGQLYTEWQEARQMRLWE